MLFKESNLSFRFSKGHWKIKKYDTHRYYKILSGAGLKGVDFLGIFEEKKIIYFEVKNFRSANPNKVQVYSIFEDTEGFIHQIAAKLMDTRKAIDIIARYLQRKWWYRLYLKSKSFFPEFLIKTRDWFFWHQIIKISRKKEQQVLVLWLEIDQQWPSFSNEIMKQQIDEELENKLADYVDYVQIANSNQPVFPATLSVNRET